MASLLNEYRVKNPEYDKFSDSQLLQGLYNQFYQNDFENYDKFVNSYAVDPESIETERFGRRTELVNPPEDQESTSLWEDTVGGLQKGIAGLKPTAYGIAAGFQGLIGDEEDQDYYLQKAREAELAQAQIVKGFQSSKQAYQEEGIGGLTGHLLQNFGISAPEMVQGYAGAAAGAAIGTGFFGVGALPGAIIGGTIALIPSFFGRNILRQDQSVRSGEKVDINEFQALMTAPAQAAADSVLYALLPRFLKTTTPQAGITKKILKGGAVGFPTEAGTEVFQQFLERAQAGGLDYATSEDAMKEYAEAGFVGGVLGGTIGGVTGPLNIQNKKDVQTENQVALGNIVEEIKKKDIVPDTEISDEELVTEETDISQPIIPDRTEEVIPKEVVKSAQEQGTEDGRKLFIGDQLTEKIQEITDTQGEEAAKEYYKSFAKEFAIVRRTPAPAFEAVTRKVKFKPKGPQIGQPRFETDEVQTEQFIDGKGFVVRDNKRDGEDSLAFRTEQEALSYIEQKESPLLTKEDVLIPKKPAEGFAWDSDKQQWVDKWEGQRGTQELTGLTEAELKAAKVVKDKKTGKETFTSGAINLADLTNQQRRQLIENRNRKNFRVNLDKYNFTDLKELKDINIIPKDSRFISNLTPKQRKLLKERRETNKDQFYTTNKELGELGVIGGTEVKADVETQAKENQVEENEAFDVGFEFKPVLEKETEVIDGRQYVRDEPVQKFEVIKVLKDKETGNVVQEKVDSIHEEENVASARLRYLQNKNNLDVDVYAGEPIINSEELSNRDKSPNKIFSNAAKFINNTISKISPTTQVLFATDKIVAPEGSLGFSTSEETVGDIQGWYDQANDVIYLSLQKIESYLDPKTGKPTGAIFELLSHESFHALKRQLLNAKNKGVFTQQENKALDEAFSGGKLENLPSWVKNTLGKDAMDYLTKKYGKRDLSSEEMQAYVFQVWNIQRASGKRAPVGNIIQRAFKKLSNVFEKTKRFLQGKGYNTWESIFELAGTGEVGRRGLDFKTTEEVESFGQQRAEDVKKAKDVPTKVVEGERVITPDEKQSFSVAEELGIEVEGKPIRPMLKLKSKDDVKFSVAPFEESTYSVLPVAQKNLEKFGYTGRENGFYRGKDSKGEEVDITGKTFGSGRISVNSKGIPAFDVGGTEVETDIEKTTGEALVKTNLFKKSAGWKWTDKPTEGNEKTLISVETRGKHYYTLNADFNKPVNLRRYDTQSEPRLRPTTYVNKEEFNLGNKIGKINLRGVSHPVYDTIDIGNVQTKPTVETTKDVTSPKFSVAEVPSDPKERAKFYNDNVAEVQRDKPEEAMLRANYYHAGVLNPQLEQIGDLIHRATENGGIHGAVKEKVDRAVRQIERGDDYYGGNLMPLLEEHEQNIVNNVNIAIEQGKNITKQQYKDKLNKLLENYVAEHKKMPTYNELQENSKQAAIAIGNLDIPRTLMFLKRIKKVTDKGDKFFNEKALESFGDTDAVTSPKFSVESSIEMVNKPPTIEGTGKIQKGKKRILVDDVFNYLENNTRSKNNNQPLDITNEENFQNFVDQGVAEFEYQITQPVTGMGWYDKDVAEAMALLDKYIPELKEYPVYKELMPFLTAISSAGTPVGSDWVVGTKVIRDYIKTGKIPSINPETKKPFTRYPSTRLALEFTNWYIQKNGLENFLTWVDTPTTIAEIRKIRKESGVYKSTMTGKAEAEVIGADMFGDKIGPFIKKLNGIKGDQNVIDVWMARHFNRKSGNIWSRNADGSIRKDKTGKLISAGEPRNNQELAIMDRYINEIAKRVGQSNDDTQAVLWYFEQGLYTKLGVKSEPASYADKTKEEFKNDEFKGSIRKGEKTDIKQVQVPTQETKVDRDPTGHDFKKEIEERPESSVAFGKDDGVAYSIESLINSPAETGIESFMEMDVVNSEISSTIAYHPPKVIAKFQKWLDDHPNFKNKAIDYRIKFQDKLYRGKQFIEVIQKEIGKAIPDSLNFYVKEEKYWGKVKDKVNEIREKYFEPINRILKSAKITINEIDDFLYARHAISRNKKIREAWNSTDLKVREKYKHLSKEDSEMGSGMSDADALSIISDVDASPKKDSFYEISKIVDQMMDLELDAKLSAGLYSKEQTQEAKRNMDHYVPLAGIDYDVDVKNLVGTGIEIVTPTTVKGNRTPGFSIGKEGPSSTMSGRTTEARHILAQARGKLINSIIRSEKNLVAESFFKFTQQYEKYFPNAWIVDPKKEDIDTYLKDIEEYNNNKILFLRTKKYQPGTLFKFMQDGKERQVLIRDDFLARGLKNLGSESGGRVVRAMGNVTRYLAAVNTAFNPEFIIGNATRDLGTAGINLTEESTVSFRNEAFKGWFPSLRAALRIERGKKATGGKTFKMPGMDGSIREYTYDELYDEFKANGGRVGFFQALQGIDSQVIDMLDDMGDISNPKKLLKFIRNNKLLNFIENINAAVENGIRISAYRAARMNGVSIDKSISLAKNLTVNFNRKGEWGSAINAFYIFYNASIQGSVRIAQAAYRSPKVRKMLYGIVGFGFFQDILNRALAGEDEDGRNRYDKINSYTKSHSMIMWIPGTEKFISIPIPYGYNAFYTAGQSLAASLPEGVGANKRQVPIGESAKNVVKTVTDVFNPIGGANNLIEFVSPTLAKPYLQLRNNEDYAGRAIYPPDNPFAGNAGPPDSQTYWSANTLSVGAANMLNSLTGGNKVEKGLIDIHPESIEFMVGEAFGGMGDTAMKTGSLVKTFLSGKWSELTPNQVPIFRKFYKAPPEFIDKQYYFDIRDELSIAKDLVEYYREEGDKDSLKKVRKEKKEILRLESRIKNIESRRRTIRKAINRIEENKKLSDSEKEERIKKFREKENEILARFIKQADEILG